MKSLPSAPLTQEDIDVQIDVVLRVGRIIDASMLGYWLMERSIQGDRRDAELMLVWMQHWPVDLAPIWRRNYPLVRETAHAFHGIPVEFYE
jgi:hypothetical protein